ncbi:hypothetical protein C0J52_04847 [Blattella germanica]|nr:hypothetical protein C0J52_04847 [Blattella germanica]
MKTVTRQKSIPDTDDDDNFTLQELQTILKRFNPGKAPGPDGITNDILLQAFYYIPTILLRECPCMLGAQTVDHLIYLCPKLDQQRNRLKGDIKSALPVTQKALIEKFSNQLAAFVKSIDFSTL